MKKRLTIIAATVSGAVVLTAFAFYQGVDGADGKEEELHASPCTRAVKIVSVDSHRSSRTATYPGITQAKAKADLFFRVGGPSIDVSVRPGDAVKKGQVLMRIDPRDYRNRIESIENQLDASRARLTAMKTGARIEDIQVLEASINASRARLDKTDLDYARAENLYAGEVIPKSKYDAAKSAHAVAAEELRALERELEKAKAGERKEEVDAAEAQIRVLETEFRIARDRLEDTYLRAPFDGVVTRQILENHEMAQPGAPVLAMHDIATIEVAVAVPEHELVSGICDQDLVSTVRFVAVPEREFEAKLVEWNTEADPVTRTYSLVFDMPQPKDVNVLPGMTAEVSVAFPRSDDASVETVVPSGAVVSDGKGRDTVWVLGEQENRAEMRAVTLGEHVGDSQLTVLAGLEPGERIVAAGADFVEIGMELVPWSEARTEGSAE